MKHERIKKISQISVNITGILMIIFMILSYTSQDFYYKNLYGRVGDILLDVITIFIIIYAYSTDRLYDRLKEKIKENNEKTI